MGIANDWHELMFGLECLQKGNAKRQFRQAIKYSFGGLCAYCRSARATTLDHVKPRSQGGESLRSNLVPACIECNHSKGSENWLVWYQRQEFYNRIAQELIEEHTSCTYQGIDYEERRTNNRTEVRSYASKVRSEADEPPSVGENSLAVA